MTTGFGQLDFGGNSKAQIAIARLQNFEPPEGYYLAFSGGKDSSVILALAKQAGVRFDAHYHITTADPPEVVSFVKTFADVSRERPTYPPIIVTLAPYIGRLPTTLRIPAILALLRPEYLTTRPKTMWNLLPWRGLPRRQGRWCCEELKEGGGTGRVVVTGIRHAESARRAGRKMVETCYQDTSKRYVNPIVDWTDTDVWEYLKVNNLPYCSLYDEGASGPYAGDGDWRRLGCVLCPMTRDVDRQIARWPEIAAAWRRASDRLYARGTTGTKRFPSADAMWAWWIDRDASAPDPAQHMMFD